MNLYDLLARVFPHSYLMKFTSVLVVSSVLPLVAVALIVPDLFAQVAMALAAGAVASFVMSVFAVRSLLKPVGRLAFTMREWGRTGRVLPLPEGYTDDIGTLLARTNRLLARAQRSLDRSWTEEDSDPLTGALNLQGAERLLVDAPAGWLIAMDLDKFDLINVDLGRREGDRILCDVVQICSDVLRQDDMLARIDSDMFLVFLPGASREVAGRISARLGRAISEDIFKGDLTLTASFGLANYQGGGEVSALLTEVEEQLQRAKNAGGNIIAGANSEGAAAA
ncbi:GGDEF domain-containing protein [Aestuariibius sp. HNIBRBA575]|uniref:GGDEF domain-containing protein n=1 Tax=Aestuariibius sp. HNIBRBA575 TaxID=3233343 RepID=UPI0034A34CF0